VSRPTDAVEALAGRLRPLGWVTDLWVAGSLATGDHVLGVSDLDLVAVVDGAITPQRREAIAQIHRDLDEGAAAGTDLGCQYADAGRLHDVGALHPTWTHGSMVDRIVSGITRAELVRQGTPCWVDRPRRCCRRCTTTTSERQPGPRSSATGPGRHCDRGCG
jgi:hypothetical protein